MNETILKMVRELGQEIKKDPRVSNYFTCENAYLSNVDLNRYLCEYNADQELVQKEFAKEERDQELIDTLNKRIRELYDLITEHEAYEALVRAKDEYDTLMNEVNTELQSAITGKTACTHDCSTCHGCH